MRDVDVTQRFALSATEVAAAYRDPQLYPRFADIGVLDQPDVLDISERDGRWRARVRYRFVGELGHPLVAKVVDPKRLTWVEETVVDHTGSGTFTIVADHYAKLLGFTGRIEASEPEPSATARRLRGVLTLHLPFVARPFTGAAEGAISAGLAEAAHEQVPIVESFAGGQR